MAYWFIVTSLKRKRKRKRDIFMGFKFYVDGVRIETLKT